MQLPVTYMHGDTKKCEHKRVWEMTSVSTQGYYIPSHEPSEDGFIRETTYTTGALWWKKEHKYSDLYEIPIETYDPTKLNEFLEDGWEPFATKDWSVSLKRLKPCEECENMI